MSLPKTDLGTFDGRNLKPLADDEQPYSLGKAMAALLAVSAFLYSLTIVLGAMQ